MIISFGQRTDIVTYYTQWMFNRFREGVVCARNPLFPSKITRYLLTPEKVDAVVFRSKDYSPALQELPTVTNNFRTLFQFTINAYGKRTEPRSPAEGEAIRTFASSHALPGANMSFGGMTPFSSQKDTTCAFIWIHLPALQKKQRRTWRAASSTLPSHLSGCTSGSPCSLSEKQNVGPS